MTTYRITAPNGKTYEIEGPPGASQAEVIQAVLAQSPEAGVAPPETTFLGQTKEAFKGLIPGAVGLVEQAAIGASALLPEEQERAAREAIASTAGALKAPFAPAPGYEETVGRKLGEAVGSTGPFLLAAGPLGLAGRFGAVGLGVGAGAGEARTRAEAEGATAEQRGTATALGTLPGALEVFAPFRILSRIPEGEVLNATARVRRVLTAAGEEAAQEAASGLAQNMIARGVYKPEQELIEGLGEQAAYGGATGAIVQGLMDLALGRRARGAGTAPEVEAEAPIDRLKREAAEKAQAAEAAQAPEAAQAEETPAEPIVRKPAGPKPLPEVLDSETVKTIGFVRGRIHDALVGKSITDPEIRAILEEYKQGKPSPKTVAKIDAFLGRLPETAPTPPVPEAPTAPEVVPPTTPAVEAVTIETQPSPTAFSNLVRSQFGEPQALVAKNKDGEEVGRLTYMPGGGPIDVFVREQDRRKGIGTALYDAFEARGGKLPSVDSGVAISDEARAVRAARDKHRQEEVPSDTRTEPATGGAGVPVATEPAAVSAPAGAGVVEPTGVVPPAADAGQPVVGEGAEPSAVTAPAPAPAPEYTEEDIDRAVELGIFTEEQAESYREALRGEEAPQTAMGLAFERQISDIKARMDALKQKNGRAPAPKSPKRKEYDALKAQLNTLVTAETGDLAKRLKKMEASGVIGVRGERPVIDIDAVKKNLLGARAKPSMYQAVLAYIGVDTDGNYLPTTYSREEAAELAGLGRGSGANVSRVAQAMGIDAEAISRFHAGQTDIIVRGKDVSEAGTGATDLQPSRGVLYEAPKKNKPGRAVGFLRDALTPQGTLDFSKLPLNSKKATKDSPAVTGLAEIYARASNYDPKRGSNEEIIKQLNAEIAARVKVDRKGMQNALDRAYRVVRAEEEAQQEAEVESDTEEDVEPTVREGRTGARRLEGEEKASLGEEETDESQYQLRKQSAAGMSKEQVEKAVAQVTEGWTNVPPIEVVQSETDLPQSIQSEIAEAGVSGQVPGLFNNGKVWLIADNNASRSEVFDTIAHEVTGHYGLRGVLGEKYGETMGRIYDSDSEIRTKADEKTQKLKGLKREVAVEEVLADMQEKDRSRPLFKRIVGMIRTALQKLFKGKHYFSRDQVEDLLRQSRVWVRMGKKPAQASAGATTRFRTKSELVGEPEKATAGDYLGRTVGERKTIGFRAQMMDSLAGVEATLGEAYAERVSDQMGNKNPVVLLSRALDSQRFAAEMLNVGTMVVDPSGMTRLTELDYNGQNISYASVMRDVAAEAKQRGLSGEVFVKQFGEVLAGRREYELMQDPESKGLDFFLTPEQAEAANDRFNNDAFIKDAAAKLDAIRFAGIDLLVGTERITPDKAKEWKDATAYTPFKRIDKMDKEAVAQGQGGMSSDLKLAAFREMKAFKGSKERQTINPLENFVDLMEWMVRESMKNEAVRRALGDMDLIGAAKRVPNPQTVPNNQKGALVSAYEKGQQKFYLVPDPANLAAFTGFKAGSTIFPVRAMQKFSQVLRVGVTATPPFAVKQIFDDITRLYVHSGVENPAALVPRMLLNFPRAWWAEIRGLRTPGMEMLARHGVVPTYDTIEGGNVRNIFEETGISKRSIGKAILRIMEAGAKASDISARQAIFDQTMKETGDADLAEQRAREIINFSRKGASATADTLIRVVPFFNAYARSMDKLLLAAAGNPAMQKTLGMSTGYARNLFFKRMGVLTAMGLSYALLMSDDEEYQALSDTVRDRNWVLPYGKELGFTPVIPLPGELAFFFKAIPERVVQYVKLQGTPEERDALRVAKEMMLAGIDLFWAPNLTPQMVKPFVENLANYSFFLGRPLESQAQQQLDPSKRFGTGTSEAVKAGAEALSEAGIELSPIKIENAIRGVFGMSAGIALSVADALVNPTRTDRPLHQQIIPQLTGASALMKDPVGNRFLDDIYDLDKKVEQAYNTYKKEEKDDPEKANAYYLRTFGLQSIREEMKGVMNAIREMNAQARAIDKMTDIPSEERAQLIADLKSQQNELARASYTLRRRAALAQMEVGG